MKKVKFISCASSLMVLLLASCGTNIVSPNTKENEIIGLEAEYSVICGDKFEDEKARITSASGDVEYTFYRDQELKEKYYDIKFDGLVGSLSGGSATDYWVKVTAGGGATGYQEVSQVAKIVANCEENDVPYIPKDCISYITTSCKHCNVQIGAGVLMNNEDVILVELDKDEPVFNYGLSHATLVKVKTSDEPFEVNDIRFSMYDDERINSFNLPRINFAAFSDRDIVLKFRSNNRPTWGAQFALKFGTDHEASNLFDGEFEDPWNINPNGTLVMHYSTEKEILTIRSCGRLEKCVEITDTKIINGKNPIVLYGKGISRSFVLYNGCIYLSHEHAWSSTAPTDKIGNKINQCTICHYSEPSTDLMTTEDVELHKGGSYGANPGFDVTKGDEEGNRGLTGGIGWQADGDQPILFPRVDYTLFSNVIFEFGTSSQSWAGVGLSINSEKDLLDISAGVGVYGVIKAEYNSISKELVLTSMTSTRISKTVVVTDEDIINGTSPLSGTLHLPTWRSFYINKIDLNHSEHVVGGLTGSSTLIGHKVGTCSVCLDEFESEEVMTNADISLSVGGCYGANPGFNVAKGDEEGNRGIVGGIGWQQITEGVPEVSMRFPRIDYTLFDNVVFEFGTSSASWAGVGLSINSEKDLLDISASVGVYGVIKAEYNSVSNELVLTSRTSNGLVKSVAVSDENVIHGVSALSGTLHLPTWRCFYLNKIDLNHNEHVVGSTTSSSTVIGYKVGTCSVCLEETETNIPMEDSDINLAIGYGVGSEGLSGFQGYDGTKITLSVGDSNTGWIMMPRVNYKLYSSVTFAMPFKPCWGYIGFDSENTMGYFGEGGMDVFVYLTVTQVEGEFHAMLSCPSKSKSLESVIINENVLDGTESLKIYHTQAPYSALYLTSINVVAL